MSEQVDCVVVGAGVVGLAVARALAIEGREVLVLEAESGIGTGISSRNSEVIHAGIYYPTGSLKATLCVAGRRQLYQYVEERAVEHRRLGKLIVATSINEVPALKKYEAQARLNGVDDLRWPDADEIREMEPNVRCVAAVLSPSTGIIDSHGLMGNYRADLEARGGTIVFRTRVVGGQLLDDAVELEVDGDPPATVRAATVINCAGLEAPTVSSLLRGLSPDVIPRRYFAKGHYFALSGRSPFRRLIYPVANAAGLGTHVTLDLQGAARFGPDVLWLEEIDYGFDENRRIDFLRAIQLYYPDIQERQLQPAYTGIRPKISSPSEPAADFRILGPAAHGRSPYIALYGIESPGLTASMAIADVVCNLSRAH